MKQFSQNANNVGDDVADANAVTVAVVLLMINLNIWPKMFWINKIKRQKLYEKIFVYKKQNTLHCLTFPLQEPLIDTGKLGW